MVKLVICAIRLNAKTGRAVNGSRNCYIVEAATMDKAQEIIARNSQNMRIESCSPQRTLIEAIESYQAECGEIKDMDYFVKVYNAELDACVVWK